MPLILFPATSSEVITGNSISFTAISSEVIGQVVFNAISSEVFSSQVSFIAISSENVITPQEYQTYFNAPSNFQDVLTQGPYVVYSNSTPTSYDSTVHLNYALQDATGSGSYVATDKLLLPPVSLICNVGSNDIAPFVQSCKVSWPFNGKARFTCSILEYDLATGFVNISPTLFDDVIKGFSYIKSLPTLNSTDNNPNGVYGPIYETGFKLADEDKVTVNVLVGGSSTNFPRFVRGESPSISGEPAIVNWECDDYSILLEQSNQSLGDIQLHRNPMSAQACTTATCGIYGINSVQFNYPDYPIKELRRTQGIPENWVDQCSRPYQAFRHFEGEVLFINSYAPTGSITPSGTLWTLTDVNAEIEDANIKLNRVKNHFTLSRLAKQFYLGEQDCSGGKCVGRTVNVSFSSPSTTVVPLWSCPNGVLQDFVYFDKDGNPIPGSNGFAGPTQSVVPIYSVQATYKPNLNSVLPSTAGQIAGVGNVTYQAPAQTSFGYHIFFSGETSNGIGSLNPVPVDDTAIQGLYGINPEYTVIEDPIIPTQAILSDYATAFVLEAVRKGVTGTVKTRFLNPFLKPGHRLLLTDTQSKQNGKIFFIDQVDFVMESPDEWYMELTISRPETTPNIVLGTVSI